MTERMVLFLSPQTARLIRELAADGYSSPSEFVSVAVTFKAEHDQKIVRRLEHRIEAAREEGLIHES